MLCTHILLVRTYNVGMLLQFCLMCIQINLLVLKLQTITLSPLRNRISNTIPVDAARDEQNGQSYYLAAKYMYNRALLITHNLSNILINRN